MKKLASYMIEEQKRSQDKCQITVHNLGMILTWTGTTLSIARRGRYVTGAEAAKVLQAFSIPDMLLKKERFLESSYYVHRFTLPCQAKLKKYMDYEII